MQYTASNGFHIAQAPVTEQSIHAAIDAAVPDFKEYWALIEYLEWFAKRFAVPKTRTFYG